MHNLDRLMRNIQYQFKKSSFLEAALTHRSVKGINNERLEYLGDSLLNFFIAEYLFEEFQEAKEGELSRLRSSLVKGETLAELAQEFHIGDYLRLGPGELKTGGFTRKSILADALEAIIGAIYLDAGFDVCRNLVIGWFGSRMKDIHLIDQKDPKTKLQEYLQAKKLPLPKYEVTTIEGEAHAQVFHIRCEVSGLPHVVTSTSTSRRKAEQIAAEKFFELMNKT